MSAELVPLPDPTSAAVDDGFPDAVADALAAIPTQARSDAELLALWLHGRAAHTQRAYQRAVGRFVHSVRKPLPAVTLGDLQAFAAELEAEGLAPASRRLTLAAVKSLLAFGQRVGYLRFDVGAAVKLPPVKDALAERILDREAVLRLLDREPDARNRALLRLLYAGGLRVSEACALRWRDLQPREDAGQVTVYGKGGKTRVVLLSPATWRVLLALPGAQAVGADDEAGAGVAPRSGRAGVPEPPERRAARPAPGLAPHPGRRGPGGAPHREGRGVAPLAAPRPRHPRPGARARPDPPGAGHPRARLRGHHQQVPARAPHGQLGALPRGVGARVAGRFRRCRRF